MSAREGVLIARSQLVQQRKIVTLEKDARRNASRIVKTAEQEAAQIRSEAFASGYQDGMLSAVRALVLYIGDCNSQEVRQRRRLEAYVRAMLSAALSHPGTLLAVLDEWLNEFDSTERSATLHLLLPVASRSASVLTEADLRDAWDGPVIIDYHDEPHFVMRCADQIAEFSPARFVDDASRGLQRELSDLPDACRQLSDVSVAALRRVFESHFNNRDVRPSGTNDERDESYLATDRNWTEQKF
ncbi:hypothetical protein WJ64_32670 [Burkholderia ubonensis]|nr:hypothetical protein WJ64_32670 [Burkholderia ubonensis]